VGIKSDVPGIYDGTLSVTVRGVTLSLPLHAEFLTALPHASWEPQDVDFGLILPQFTEPRTKVVTLTNDGGGPLTIYDSVWQVNFFTGFTTTNDCGSSLPSGHSCHFTVTLIPSGLGYYNNYLVLSSSNVQYTGFSVNARIFDVFQWGQRPARPSGNPPAISGGSGNGITAPQRPGRNERSIPSQDLPLAGLPLRSASSLLYPIVEADYLPVTKADRLRER
jgi:hypothetical protein